MRRRIWAILLSLCLIGGLLPMAALAVDGTVITEQELRDAIAQGGEVTLGGDITLTTSGIKVSKEITLNLNGHTISDTITTAPKFIFLTDSTNACGSLTINGPGTITSSTGCTAAVQINKGGALTLNDVTVNSGKGSAVTASGSSSANTTQITINGGALSSANNAGVTLGTGNVSAVICGNASITGDNFGINSYKCTIILESGTITSTKTGASRGYSAGIKADTTSLTIREGTVTGVDCGVYVEGTSTVTIGDGMFNAATSLDEKNDGVASISITGGMFSSDVSAYVAEDYMQGADGTVGKVEDVAEAQIGDAYYATLAEAVDAAEDGDTIYLLKDADNGDGIIVEGESKRTLTIDFQGHTYTVTQNLAGSDGTESQCFQLLEGSTITMKNGKITGSNNGIKMIVQNYSNLTLTDMTLDGTNISNLNYALSNNCGDVLLNGNTNITVPDGAAALDVSWWPGPYPAGTHVTLDTDGAIHGNIEVGFYGTNGTITVPSKSVLAIKDVGLSGTIDYYAPTTGTYATGLTDEETKAIVQENITITGGYFTEDPSTYVENGYAALAYNDDTYKYVVKIPEIFTVSFETEHGTAPESQKLTEDNSNLTVTLPSAPEVDGYTFVGWELEGKTYQPGEVFAVTENVRFTARWNKIVPSEGSTKVEVFVGETFSGIDSSLSDNETATAFAEALPEVQILEDRALSDAAVEVAQRNEVIKDAVQKAADEGVTAGEDRSLTVVVETYLDIKIKDISDNSVTLDITPKYDVIVSDGPTEAKVIIGETMEIEDEVEVTLPLPGIFSDSDSLFVRHKKDEDSVYYYVAEKSGNTISFTNPHGFSEFTIMSDVAELIPVTRMGPNENAVPGGENQEYAVMPLTAVGVEMRTELTTGANVPSGKRWQFKGWTISASKEGADTVTIAEGVAIVTEDIYLEMAAKIKDGYDITMDCLTPGLYSSSGGGGGSRSSSYSITVESCKNGSVSVSPKSANKGTTVTITVKPDSGYELDELVVTDKNGDELKLTAKGDNKYTFAMPTSKVNVEASFVNSTDASSGSFTDVPSSAYYYDAVEWAVDKGITSGTSATTFSPNASCTRAQMVTFLWRAAGSPVVNNYAMPFTDVDQNAYYAEAVRWAVSEGITAGTSATTFSPDATVTRSQTVTFLYRNAGAPGTTGTTPFMDVASDAYYADAVSWAVNEEITAGTSATTFSPNDACTRAQIVTFLYREMA